jgi:hypothetical protein
VQTRFRSVDSIFVRRVSPVVEKFFQLCVEIIALRVGLMGDLNEARVETLKAEAFVVGKP